MDMKELRVPGLVISQSPTAWPTPTRRGWVGAESVPPGLTEDGPEMKQGPGFCFRYRKTDSEEPGWCSGWYKTNILTRSRPQCAYHAAERHRAGRVGFCHSACHANGLSSVHNVSDQTLAVVH